jgi:hypothetical protein
MTKAAHQHTPNVANKKIIEMVNANMLNKLYF